MQWENTHFVGYEDQASVATVLKCSNSQAIYADNMAYTQTFERLNKPFKASRVSCDVYTNHYRFPVIVVDS